MAAANWRMRMHEQRELKKMGTAVLYERVLLLIEIEKDPQFTAWCEQQGVAVLDQLDDELADVAFEYLTLKAMMEQYPTIEEWQAVSLRQMVAQYILDTKPERKPKSTLSWKERCLAAEKECERLRAENNTLRARLTEVQSALQVAAGGRYRDTPAAKDAA